MKNVLKALIRILITVAVLFFVLKSVDFSEMLTILKGVNISMLLFSFVVYVIMVMLCTLRWHKLLMVQQIPISYGRTFAYYLIGFFYNNILPTTVGGGVVRALYAGKWGGKTKAAFSSMLVELILGGWALIIFALIASLFYLKSLSLYLVLLPLVGMFIFVSIVLYLFFHRGVMKRFKVITDNIKIFGISQRLKDLYEAMYIYKDKKTQIIEVILLSFGIQMIVVVMNLLIGVSLGFKLPFMSYVIYPVIIGLMTTVPLTINGIGIREWGYRFFFSQVGLSGSQAVILSLLFYFVTTIGSLLGGIVFPFVRSCKEG